MRILVAALFACSLCACEGPTKAPTELRSVAPSPELRHAPEDALRRRLRCQEPPPPSSLPIVDIGPTEVASLVKDSPDSLGSASIGRPTRGALWGGVRLTSSENVEVVTSPYAWGTEATVASIARAARIARCRYPDAQRLHVGSLSRRHGGPLFPHRSHQNGLDADLGYLYTDSSRYYQHATAENLDVAATWALIEALHDGGNVEYLFIDRSIQPLLRAHAEKESPELLTPLFDGTLEKQPLIRHARGHRTHLHVRFLDRPAQRNAKHVLPHIQARYRFASYRR